MKSLVISTVAVVALVSGCASAEQSTTEAPSVPDETVVAEVESTATVDPQEMDAILDHFVMATLTLTQMNPGTLEEGIADFETAQSELTQMGTALEAGVPGIPQDTTDAVLTALDQVQTAFTALIECYRSPLTETCDAESTVANEAATALGAEVAALIPYGSRSEEEFLAALGSSSDSSVTEMETESVSQSNAVEMAQNYLDYSSFSRQGLIEQLEYEGFSTADATYAVDSVGADWNEQAALKAQEYLDYSAFSRQGLIDQLEYEGFTSAEAAYGVAAVGL